MNDLELNHHRILIVDDSQSIHEDFRKILMPAASANDGLDQLEAELFGAARQAAVKRYELESAMQGQEALAKVQQALQHGRPFALAFVDMRMPPGWDGLQTIEKIWEVDPELQVVICTAYSDHSHEEILARTGRSHRLVILKKPFDNAEIAQLACSMTEKWRASRLAAVKMNDLEQKVAERTADIARANEKLTVQVAQLERMSKALEASEERYALAARGANDGLWDCNLITGEVYYSPRWRAIAGLSESTPYDHKPCPTGTSDLKQLLQFWLQRVHPNDLPWMLELIDHHVQSQTEHFESEHRLCLPNGNNLWVLCRGTTVRDEHGRPYRFAGSLSDISARKTTEEQLRRRAYYDRLTELPNNALLKECLNRAIQYARLQTNPLANHFALLFLDLDRFKVVNDSLGHLAGDQLLVEISRRLNQALQSGWPGRGFTLARLGGDEFVILMEAVTSDREPVLVAQAVHRCFESAFLVQGHEVHTSVSIGIALCNGTYSSAEEILRDADTAMYDAKASGRARHSLFNFSMREAAISRLCLESDLRLALAHGEITVAYQPIVSLENCGIVAIEALARWTHPELGFINPDRFIQIAEETGLILPLGEHVMRTACRDLRAVQRAHDCNELIVNVNLSANQFSSVSLIGTIQSAVREAGISARNLAVELTESTVMDDFDEAAAAIRCMRDIGISIYMDDFGTGYSSLSCLRSLPLNGLKLDRSFVAMIGTNVANPAIIHAIVTLASHLKLKVVAEGIESSDQLAGVIALNCDMAQGYLFGRPMPLDGLIQWMSQPLPQAKAA